MNGKMETKGADLTIMTDHQVRKLVEDHKVANNWRFSQHCMRSIFSVVPEEILEKSKVK